MAETIHSSDTIVAEKQELKEPSQYNIIVHNNHETSYEEVVYIVSKGFEMTEDEAYDIASNVDKAGQGVCGTYSKEIAETKLVLIDAIKDSLVTLLPYRSRPIKILQFTMEKV